MATPNFKGSRKVPAFYVPRESSKYYMYNTNDTTGAQALEELMRTRVQEQCGMSNKMILSTGLVKIKVYNKLLCYT